MGTQRACVLHTALLEQSLCGLTLPFLQVLILGGPLCYSASPTVWLYGDGCTAAFCVGAERLAFFFEIKAVTFHQPTHLTPLCELSFVTFAHQPMASRTERFKSA